MMAEMTEEYKNFVSDNYRRLTDDLEELRARLGITREITVCAATKTVSPPAINLLAEHGLRRIGENRVNELEEKLDEYDKSLSVDFIGTLQTNKIKKLVGRVSLIQSLSGIEAAKILDRLSSERGIISEALVEVNSGRESGKSGVMPEDCAAVLDEMSGFEHIKIRGLMTIGAAGAENSELRKYFEETYRIFIDIYEKIFHNIDDNILSMGMSDSYRTAIECGATMIRPGSLLFGKRK